MDSVKLHQLQVVVFRDYVNQSHLRVHLVYFKIRRPRKLKKRGDSGLSIGFGGDGHLQGGLAGFGGLPRHPGTVQSARPFSAERHVFSSDQPLPASTGLDVVTNMGKPSIPTNTFSFGGFGQLPPGSGGFNFGTSESQKQEQLSTDHKEPGQTENLATTLSTLKLDTTAEEEILPIHMSGQIQTSLGYVRAAPEPPGKEKVEKLTDINRWDSSWLVHEQGEEV